MVDFPIRKLYLGALFRKESSGVWMAPERKKKIPRQRYARFRALLREETPARSPRWPSSWGTRKRTCAHRCRSSSPEERGWGGGRMKFRNADPCRMARHPSAVTFSDTVISRHGLNFILEKFRKKSSTFSNNAAQFWQSCEKIGQH